jgi:hypothetical protein
MTETDFIIGENPIKQQYSDTCAIKSQQLIMQDFGIQCSEDQLVGIATEMGIYNGGTLPQHTGILLEQAGIPVTQTPNATVFDLTNELAQGHRIIVAVDSGELWARDLGLWEQFKEWWADVWGNELGQADHALIVTSIDNRDPNKPEVVLTDPGSGEIRHYPLEQFMDAWRDSGCYMVSTDLAPAEFAAIQMKNSQPSQHLADIAGVNFDDFQLFHDMAYALPPFDAWDYATNPFHPVHSLMDAYFQYGQDLIEFAAFNQFAFYPYLDPALFSVNFVETYNFGFNQLYPDYQTEMAAMQDFLALQQDITATHDYFNTQALHFDSMGNAGLADFYEQQVHYMDMCQDLGIDPMAVYNPPI